MVERENENNTEQLAFEEPVSLFRLARFVRKAPATLIRDVIPELGADLKNDPKGKFLPESAQLIINKINSLKKGNDGT